MVASIDDGDGLCTTIGNNYIWGQRIINWLHSQSSQSQQNETYRHQISRHQGLHRTGSNRREMDINNRTTGRHVHQATPTCSIPSISQSAAQCSFRDLSWALSQTSTNRPLAWYSIDMNLYVCKYNQHQWVWSARLMDDKMMHVKHMFIMVQWGTVQWGTMYGQWGTYHASMHGCTKIFII